MKKRIEKSSHERWTEEDDKLLLGLYEHGLSNEEVASHFEGRSAKAVYDRKYILVRRQHEITVQKEKDIELRETMSDNITNVLKMSAPKSVLEFDIGNIKLTIQEECSSDCIPISIIQSDGKFAEMLISRESLKKLINMI